MEAIDAAKDIFSRNSIGFYKLNIDTDSSSPQNIISPKLKIKEPDVQEDSSSFVRIIWVDTSGQQRCRVSFFFLVSSKEKTSVSHLNDFSLEAQKLN